MGSDCISSWSLLIVLLIREICFWNLQQMTEVTRCSCWYQNFVPKGLTAPALGLCTCVISWKKMYKIRLQSDFVFKLVANNQSDKKFLWTSKFCPLSFTDLWLFTFKLWLRVDLDHFCDKVRFVPIEHLVLLYFQVYSNSACPQHSGERYRTSGPLV